MHNVGGARVPLHLMQMDVPGQQLLPLYSPTRQLIGMVQVCCSSTTLTGPDQDSLKDSEVPQGSAR